MDLSAAILKGCEIRPEQCQHSLWSLVIMPTFHLQSCVMGAAYEGAFGPIKHVIDPIERHWRIILEADDEATDMVLRLRNIYPILETQVPGKQCRRRGYINGGEWEEVVEANISLESQLYWLNDRERWTREQFAAYVKYVVEGAPMIPEDD